MIQDEQSKLELASEIRQLVNEINLKVHHANENLKWLEIRFTQNTNSYQANSDLCVHISESQSF